MLPNTSIKEVSRMKVLSGVVKAVIFVIILFAQNTVFSDEGSEHEDSHKLSLGGPPPAHVFDHIRLPVELSIGNSIFSADNEITSSLTLGAKIKITLDRYFETVFGILAINDYVGKSVDDSRHSAWFIADASLETLPITLVASKDGTPIALGGILFRGKYSENTPSSEEHTYLGILSPTIRIYKNKTVIEFGVGAYYYYLELDDDLPAELGFERKDLFLESWGVSFHADLNHEFSSWLKFGMKNQLLLDRKGFIREATSRGELRLPLDSLSDNLSKVYFQIYGEGRYIGLGKKDSQLTFDKDVASGVNIVIELGK